MRRSRLTLKGRIAAFVFLAMAALGIGIFLVGNERVAATTTAYRAEIEHHMRRHWHTTLYMIANRLADDADTLLEDEDLRDAVSRLDSDQVTQRIVATIPALERHVQIIALDVMAADGSLLYAHGTGQAEPMVQGVAASNVLRFGSPVHGLHQTPDGRYLVVFAQPILARDAELLTDPMFQVGRGGGGTVAPIVGAFTVGLPLDQVMQVLRRQMGHDAVMTATGALTPISDALDPLLWQRLLARMEPDHQGEQIITDGSRSYDVTSFPVSRTDGTAGGDLHLVRDVTVAELRRGLLEWVTLAGSLTLGLLLVWLLYGYLSRAFAPLEEAVTVLDRLARGDTSLGLVTRRNDEIGRMATAIEVFRSRLMDLRRFDKALRRQQRRQQSFIRRQLEALASTLEADARKAVLADLARIEGGGANPADDSGSLGRELGMLAVAFRQMSERVRDQHVRLEQLVGELRDALEHKTRLIALEQELEIARNIQRSILPNDMPQVGGFEIVGDMLPAREVGGDFYDFFLIDRRHVGVLVADVSGKGVPAAFFMLIARTLLRATALFGMPPGDCLERVNALLCEENEEMMFVTLFYGILDLDSGRLDYANAGHNPPMLRRASGDVRALPHTGGMAMAVDGSQAYAQASLVLEPGDVLTMFTDGVTEAFARDGAMFGTGRLAGLLAGLDGDCRAVLQAMLAEVERFAADAEQSDDITAVVLRRTPVQDASGGKAAQEGQR